MADIYGNVPFANTGDREEVPTSAQTDNSLSWEQGYPLPYGITPSEGGKFIRRKSFNQVLYTITKGIIDFKDAITAAFTTGTLTATNANISSATAAALDVTGSGTIVTPSATAKGTELVNAEWVRNYADHVDLKVGAGYKIYTAVINLSLSATPNACVTWEDDAVGLTETQRKAIFGHYPCIFVNGVEGTKLNPNDYTKTAAGATADITTLGQDVMVKFPKRGLRIRTIGSQVKISFTDDPNSASFQYYAFTKGTEIKDAFYTGAYKGYVSGGRLYSTSGKTASVNATIGTFRGYATARGTGYGITGWFQRVYLQAMYVFIHGNLNSQEQIGRGYCSSSAAFTTGGSNTWGMDSELAKAQYPTYLTDGVHNVKCLGVEDLWGNVWEWVDGCVTQNYNVMVATTGFNDTGKGYVNTGIKCYAGYSGAYISSIAGDDMAGFYPTLANGSENTYFCDAFWQGASCVAESGGSYGYGSMCGVFCLAVDSAPSSAAAVSGSRLQFL